METIIENTLKRFASHYLASDNKHCRELADQHAHEFLESAVEPDALEFYIKKYETLKTSPDVKKMADEFKEEWKFLSLLNTYA
ncbi:hypothetical protein KY330_05305 [Candidatus Woesearchaeota archaeon]|nr:hypothetical protein [Candidatus Woesearchaeota archaeon]